MGAGKREPAGRGGRILQYVWTLLTGFYERGVGAVSGISGLNKTGGQLDPAGGPESTTTTTTSGDTGGQLDPAGEP